MKRREAVFYSDSEDADVIDKIESKEMVLPYDLNKDEDESSFKHINNLRIDTKKLRQRTIGTHFGSYIMREEYPFDNSEDFVNVKDILKKMVYYYENSLIRENIGARPYYTELYGSKDSGLIINMGLFMDYTTGHSHVSALMPDAARDFWLKFKDAVAVAAKAFGSVDEKTTGGMSIAEFMDMVNFGPSQSVTGNTFMIRITMGRGGNDIPRMVFAYADAITGRQMNLILNDRLETVPFNLLIKSLVEIKIPDPEEANYVNVWGIMKRSYYPFTRLYATQWYNELLGNYDFEAREEEVHESVFQRVDPSWAPGE